MISNYTLQLMLAVVRAVILTLLFAAVQGWSGDGATPVTATDSMTQALAKPL